MVKVKKEQNEEEKKELWDHSCLAEKKQEDVEDVEDNSLYFIFRNIKNKAGKGFEPISSTH